MAKALNTILGKDKKLEGVKSSSVSPLDLGGMTPKPKGEQNFVKKHSVEKHADRAGNGDDVYKGTTKKAPYKVAEETLSKTEMVQTVLESLTHGPRTIKFMNGSVEEIDEEISQDILAVYNDLDEENKLKFIDVAFTCYDDFVAISKLKD